MGFTYNSYQTLNLSTGPVGREKSAPSCTLLGHMSSALGQCPHVPDIVGVCRQEGLFSLRYPFNQPIAVQGVKHPFLSRPFFSIQCSNTLLTFIQTCNNIYSF